MRPVKTGKGVRMTFSRQKEVLEMPNLIEIQKNSYQWFLDEGLKEVFADISPITDFAGHLSLEFVDFTLCKNDIKYTIEECKERDATYAAPLKVKVRLCNKDKDEINEHEIFMGDLPLMTDTGSFVINGAERVIVSQLVRSPGIYYGIAHDKIGTELYSCTVIPNRGAWLEYETDSSSLGGNLLGVDQDDEMARRMVNFMEIAADTVVGELKNNFVQVGKEDGSTLYQVEIAKNQVPSLVNAGLSLFAYSVGQSHDYDYTVNYEDYSATAIQNYEKVTGETLPETFKEGYINGGNEQWYEDNEELLQKVEEVNAENWEEKYYEVLEKNNGGIVYVKTDGTYDYYADYDAFAAAKPELVADNLESYIGQDMTLEKVLCNFGVDDKGNLTSNQITVNFNTTDQDGEHHTLVITGDVTISNYGTTTVQPLDVGDREKKYA